MGIAVPAILRSLSALGSAARELASWRKRARGDTSSLIGELRDNLVYLDMVAKGDVDLAEVVDRISVSEYKRLVREGFDFNSLKRARITEYPSLKNTDLGPWCGKQTAELVESIFEKTNDLKLRYPHLKENPGYRWHVRVNNIRKRIWLLLKHVAG